MAEDGGRASQGEARRTGVLGEDSPGGPCAGGAGMGIWGLEHQVGVQLGHHQDGKV